MWLTFFPRSANYQAGRKTQWIDYEVLWALRSIASRGQPGRSAVNNALTASGTDVLQRLQKEPWHFDWMAEESREHISVILKKQITNPYAAVESSTSQVKE